MLVYAVGGEHPLRAAARAIVDAVTEGRSRATTTIEVVQEFARARARWHGRAEARVDAIRYATLFAPLLSQEVADLEAGLALFERYERLGSFDAVLAATAMRVAPSAFVSADRAFDDVEGLPFVGLASARAAGLV